MRDSQDGILPREDNSGGPMWEGSAKEIQVGSLKQEGQVRGSNCSAARGKDDSKTVTAWILKEEQLSRAAHQGPGESKV